jgi:hypothetical protein
MYRALTVRARAGVSLVRCDRDKYRKINVMPMARAPAMPRRSALSLPQFSMAQIEIRPFTATAEARIRASRQTARTEVARSI